MDHELQNRNEISTIQIAVASIFDAQDRGSWSGIPFHVLSQLRASGAELTLLGPLKRRTSLRTMLRRFAFRSLGFRYLTHRDIDVCRDYGRQLTAKAEGLQSDCILGFGTAATSFLTTNKPIILYNDATFAAMVDYYPAWCNLPGTMLKWGHEIERRALDRADGLIFATEWAAASARQHYGVPDYKINVIPMGANVGGLDRCSVVEVARAKGQDTCELLFIGYDWHRKGGDVALRIQRRLCEHGIDARLSIVGCTPRSLLRESGVAAYGILDKRRERDGRQLDWLLRTSHFLVHPARAECYGIVLCEANAFGLPVITSSTGGMASIVHDGINGYRQDDINDIDGFCRFIMKYRRPESYTALALSSHDYYTRRLNWGANREQITRVVRTAIFSRLRRRLPIGAAQQRGCGEP